MLNFAIKTTLVIQAETRGSRGLKSLTWETCSFAQNFINYMPLFLDNSC